MRETDYRFVKAQEDAGAEMKLLDNVKEGLGFVEKRIAKQNHKIEELKREVTDMEEANKELWRKLLQGVANAVARDIIEVSLVEALKGTLAPQLPGPTVTLVSESHSMEQETEKCKKSRRRGSGSREQREKDTAKAERISAVVHQPPSVEQVEMTDMGRKESITIDTEAGERSDLIEEELRRESAEPEATSEDELLKDCKEEAAGESNPLVREITFENAEELTEEGLPFLILFHHPDDTQSVKDYNDLVKRELMGEKSQVTFLTADGVKFAHPLHHLGKSKDDLPLIAIDSFRHMYLFPKYSDTKIPGKVKQFLGKLYSGQLHREFHYGPDEDEEAEPDSENVIADSTGHIPRQDDSKDRVKRQSGPVDSTFQKLAPSNNRYSFRHDEF